MANNFLRTLAKMKLVELSEEEQAKLKANDEKITMEQIDKLIAESQPAQARKSQPPPPPTKPAQNSKSAQPGAASARPAATATSIREGTPFSDYYVAGAIADAPYPVEKLLKVIEGLRQFNASQLKDIVNGMDAADDSWTIADVVLDAERKTRALAQAAAGLDETLVATQKRTDEEKAKRTAYLAEGTTNIRKRIAELEQTLAKETADIAEQLSRLDNDLQSARDAAGRERARLQEEIKRLEEVPRTFVVKS